MIRLWDESARCDLVVYVQYRKGTLTCTVSWPCLSLLTVQ